MKKSPTGMRRAAFTKNRARIAKPATMVLAGAIVAISVAVICLVTANSPKGVAAAANLMANPLTQKHYKATRPIVVDSQTRQLRMPTTQEVDELVANLATLADRPTEGLAQAPVSNGGVAIDLAGGYGGVMLARPNADGTWETKCVFTFEEGAEFLGITEDNSAQ